MKIINSVSKNMHSEELVAVYDKLTNEEAVYLVRKYDSETGRTSYECESCIGHADTAHLVGQALGCELPANRATISLQPGEVVLLAQYEGERLAEGTKILPNDAKISFFRVTMHLKKSLLDNARQVSGIKHDLGFLSKVGHKEAQAYCWDILAEWFPRYFQDEEE